MVNMAERQTRRHRCLLHTIANVKSFICSLLMSETNFQVLKEIGNMEVKHFKASRERSSCDTPFCVSWQAFPRRRSSKHEHAFFPNSVLVRGTISCPTAEERRLWRVDCWDGLVQLGDVWQHPAVQRFEGQKPQFVGDALLHWQPVQSDTCYMV